uniref:Uncharacterized protein n=1 Tax=Lygus hesperus TaxID=30085 RepID=A0A0K8T4K6_LYGHE
MASEETCEFAKVFTPQRQKSFSPFLGNSYQPLGLPLLRSVVPIDCSFIFLPFIDLTSYITLGDPQLGLKTNRVELDPFLARRSASSFPSIPSCPGTQSNVSLLPWAVALRERRQLQVNFEVIEKAETAFKAAWLSDRI